MGVGSTTARGKKQAHLHCAGTRLQWWEAQHASPSCMTGYGAIRLRQTHSKILQSISSALVPAAEQAYLVVDLLTLRPRRSTAAYVSKAGVGLSAGGK